LSWFEEDGTFLSFFEDRRGQKALLEACEILKVRKKREVD